MEKSKWWRNEMAPSFYQTGWAYRWADADIFSSKNVGLLLITATGDWVREDSREFRAVLGDPDPDYDAAMYAVRNLGFIAVRRHETMLDVILHPRNAEPAAVDAVMAM